MPNCKFMRCFTHNNYINRYVRFPVVLGSGRLSLGLVDGRFPLGLGSGRLSLSGWAAVGSPSGWFMEFSPLVEHR